MPSCERGGPNRFFNALRCTWPTDCTSLMHTQIENYLTFLLQYMCIKDVQYVRDPFSAVGRARAIAESESQDLFVTRKITRGGSCNSPLTSSRLVEIGTTCVWFRNAHNCNVMLNGCPVAWKSKLIDSMCLSTMMAEYYALSMSLREVLPLRDLVECMSTWSGLGSSVNI